ncbi:MAG: alkaline phosphatase family protein [Propionibacteriaceae bacterium]|nr:alkaline phosphatase family protein [Propionibacteriaceae bacterium]
MTEFSYGDGPYLWDLLPSVGAHLGVTGFDHDLIGLPSSRRYVVVLIDGLGWDLTLRSCAQAASMASAIGDATKLSVCLPSTTAASLMSLWTGVQPGSHGILGFSFDMGLDNPQPSSRKVATPLSFKEPIEAAACIMDTLVDQGVSVSCVVPAEHVHSGLTLMGTRTAEIIGIDILDSPARIQATLTASRQGSQSLVYVYEPRLDQTGHKRGVASGQWAQVLSEVDAFLEDLRSRLDDDVCLLVTGDHGMVDISVDSRVEIDTDPVLSQDLRLVGGEARFRHLYTDHPRAVVQRWREFCGTDASVMIRSEAIDSGLFGPVDPKYLTRIGDVVVVAQTTAYLTKSFPGEYSLVGMHGGWTSAERYVPLLVDPG